MKPVLLSHSWWFLLTLIVLLLMVSRILRLIRIVVWLRGGNRLLILWDGRWSTCISQHNQVPTLYCTLIRLSLLIGLCTISRILLIRVRLSGRLIRICKDEACSCWFLILSHIDGVEMGTRVSDTLPIRSSVGVWKLDDGNLQKRVSSSYS